MLRALKPLRIIKLLKAFKIVSVLKEELAIVLGLNTVKILALFGYLISSVHVCACGYWRAKLESNTPEELDMFLQSRGADPQARRLPVLVPYISVPDGCSERCCLLCRTLGTLM
jgi:hypothetical protein